MKKNKWFVLLLMAAMLLQVFALPVSATDVTTEPTTESLPDETQASEIPFGQVSIQNGCRTIAGMSPLDGSERKLNTAQGVFVYEMNTDTVIYSYNADTKLAPGTLTKIVTALLVVELCELDEVVTVSSQNISRLPGGSDNVNLKHDEQLTVEDLLHCLVLDNANDAAVALAEHVSGNQQGFLVLMNDRVKQMGCTSTEFNNIHGLDNATSWTTARDMARIMTEASKNETLVEVFKATYYAVPATNRTEKEREIYTRNYMISEATISKYYDPRVKIGLQSYTTLSGASLIWTAEKGNLNLVCVILGALREFNPEKTWQVTSYGNFDEMVELLEYTFGNFKVNQILYDGQSLEQFDVIDGESQVVGQPKVNYNSVLPIDAKMDNLTKYFSPLDGGLTAPIDKGEMIGTVSIWYRNSCLAEAELYAMGDVSSTSNSGLTIQGEAVRDDSDMGGALDVILTVCLVVLIPAGLYLTINAWRRSRARARRRKRRESRRRSW